MISHMWGWGDGKHNINLTKNFRTHNFTYLVCWDVKRILDV
jgi:hypothetical protein